MFSRAREQRFRHLRILQIDYWNERTLRNTAILRTTVLVAGKNGYGFKISGVRGKDYEEYAEGSVQAELDALLA